MAQASDVDRVRSFTERMAHALREDEQEGVRPPIERRKLRTILTECGKKGSAGVLAEIEARFTEAGMASGVRRMHSEPRRFGFYTDPHMTEKQILGRRAYTEAYTLLDVPNILERRLKWVSTRNST